MTVYRLIHEKELAAVQVGRSFRIPREALIEYVKKTGYAEADALSLVDGDG